MTDLTVIKKIKNSDDALNAILLLSLAVIELQDRILNTKLKIKQYKENNEGEVNE